MYSTQQNINTHKPNKTASKKNNPPTSKTTNKIVGKYLQYPDFTTKRKAEGGLRLQGKYKETLPHAPLLTIITVVYNAEQVLEQTILSVLEQDYANVEYIIIDGASSDGTLDIIKKYEDAIDYYISEPDDGIYYAMNKGIALASGQAINFMNAGDYFLPKVFGLYAQAFISSGNELKKSIVWGGVKFIYEDDSCFISDNRPLHSIFFISACHQSFFIHTDIFNLIGYFDTNYKIAADYKMLLEARTRLNITEWKEISELTIAHRLDGVSCKSAGVSIAEQNIIRYECYGKRLGLSKNFFEECSVYERNIEISHLYMLLECLKSYKEKDETLDIKLIFDIMESLGYFIEKSYKAEINELNEKKYELEYNWYYRFGQSSKKEKLKKLFSFMKRNYKKEI